MTTDKAKVIVTGAGGFIGSHLVDRLIADGYEVLAIDISPTIPPRLAHCSKEDNFQYLQCDITDKRQLQKVLLQGGEQIVHLAAVVGVRQYCEDPMGTIRTNVIGTLNVVEKALDRGIRVVYASSSEIYGKNPEVPWAETSDRILGPTSVERWSYSSSKAVCEHILFSTFQKDNLPMVIVRLFNAYGPRQSPLFVIPAMIQRALKGQAPLIYDSGEQTRCFTYIDDAIEGILLASRSPKAIGEAINIGSQQETTVAELAQLIIQLAGKAGELVPEFVPGTDIYNGYEDIPRRVPDVSKAKKLLNWEARTPLSIGLQKTMEFLQKSGASEGVLEWQDRI